MAARVLPRPHAMLRHSEWDGLLVGLSFVHAALLLVVPSIPLISIGLWWNANTIAHNFIHRPFFRSPSANRTFSAYLSLVLGIPQSLWRQRHLRHHAETVHGGAHLKVRASIDSWVLVETALVLGLWIGLGVLVPRFFFLIYLPGWALGLVLCQLQGHFEHARGTTSHYGRLYNLLFFNDGYHVEHHARPGAHWTELRRTIPSASRPSRWPPVFRWLELVNLESLERLVLRSRGLQRFVLNRHEQAFRALLPTLVSVHRATIVGGGLFPRTALILRRLLPHAFLTIVDANSANLETARSFLSDLGENVEFVHDMYTASDRDQADLVVVPLCFIGDRGLLYRRPPAPAVVVHDWMWSIRGKGAIVSWLLLKRLNLVVRT
jgi:hypothetical protein